MFLQSSKESGYIVKVLTRVLSTSLCLFWSSWLSALSIEDAWRPPQFSSPKLSPDGKTLAVAVAVNDRLNLAVLNLESRSARQLTSYRDLDVIEFHWVGNDRIVFSLGRRNAPTGPESQDGGGLFMISSDGKESKVLYPTLKELVRSGGAVYRGLSYFRSVPGSQSEILAVGRERSVDSVDLYRLNVVTGRKVLLSIDSPGRVISWVVSADLNKRVAVSHAKGHPTITVRYKDHDHSWTELWSSNLSRGPASFPLGFEGDSLVIASNLESKTMRVLRFDTMKKAIGETIAEHRRFDIAVNQLGERIPGLIWGPNDREILGFAVLEEKLRTYWFDDEMQRIQAAVDKIFPDRINQISVSGDRRKVLFASWSDQIPVKWYIFDTEVWSIEELVTSRPWLAKGALLPMKPVYVRTRDGLDLLSYLVLPRTYRPGTQVPAVVHIHGGPWVRADQWGFMSFGAIEAQLLANQGYAVLLPNFRATPGLGSDVFYRGRGEFGRKMQDDIEDATLWLVEQGYSKIGRIALSGASYGGYSTLVGLSRKPQLYQCGIAGLAVTDLNLLMTSGQGDIPQSEFGLALWKSLVGNPVDDKQHLESISPVNLANHIKVPVFMYSGGSDIRVPIEQPEKMKRALESFGNPPQYLVHADEGHGFGTLRANIVTYEKLFRFLDSCLGR